VVNRAASKATAIPGVAVLLAAVLASPLAAQTQSLRDRLDKSLVQASGNRIEIVAIRPTRLATIYEVELSTGELLHVDASGEYLFAGDMYQTTPVACATCPKRLASALRCARLARFPTGRRSFSSPRAR